MIKARAEARHTSLVSTSWKMLCFHAPLPRVGSPSGGRNRGPSGHSRYTHGHPRPSGPTHLGGCWHVPGSVSLHARRWPGNVPPLWPLHSSVVAACLLAETSSSSFLPSHRLPVPHSLPHGLSVKVAREEDLYKETGCAMP